MNYRFLKLTTIYPEYLQQFLSDHPDCDRISYEELYGRYVRTHFGWVDYYPKHLQSLGNEAQEIFTSFEALQKAWAREHGIKYDQKNWFGEIVLAQVKAFQPDVLFIEDLYLYNSSLRKQLREACAKPPRIIGYRCAPTDDSGALADLDLMLTCVPNFADQMRQSGANVAILRHAFEPATLPAVGPMIRDLDFTFSGHLVLRDGLHNQRFALVEKLLDSTSLQVWGSINHTVTGSLKRRVMKGVARRSRKLFEAVGGSRERANNQGLSGQRVSRPANALRASLMQRYPNRLHEAVFGLENYRVLARSKITFNSHIDCAADYAGNMRLFEATGMGACLLTDWKSNLPEMFEPDSEVVTYRSADECSEKVHYLLAHEAELKAIAKAGQQRTMRCHTFAHRAAQLDELIRQAFL